MKEKTQQQKVNIIQGEFKVVDDPQTYITTILGSCVAACLRDPIVGVGGMNHFLLPDSGGNTSGQPNRYGAYLMELLINEMLKKGALKSRIEAKVFGGANTIQGLSSIGQQNADFTHKFLSDEGIKVVGGSVGGNQGRKIEYWPGSGRARQFMIDAVETKVISAREIPKPVVRPEAETIEFF